MRKVSAAVIVLVMASLSGCATVSVTAEVGSADTLERYEMNISTSTTVYGFLSESAKEDGYDSIGEQFRSQAEVSEGKFDYSEEINGDQVEMSLLFTDLSISDKEEITIRETSDGSLVYKDTTFYNASSDGEEETSEMASSMMSGFVLQYKLVMPGEISSSNADEVDGNTATWTRTGSEAFSNTTIRAEGSPPTSIPGAGFGPLTALVAISVVLIVGYLSRSR